ncbi:helix-turn-helix domain-containing protein [Gallicola sp. Sow4_E12]|uniref:helix-turn-helix domain-containing protein n=1 Tax=Gallicola sp. Sow4_E12 TaxID=3438785 RepID=UPI003F8E3B48
MSFSENLRNIREERNISTTELAKAIGKTQTVIEFYESEEYSLEYPDRDTLEALAKALGVTVEDLIEGKYISPDRQFLSLVSDQTIRGLMDWYNLEETIMPEKEKGNVLSDYYDQAKVDVLVAVIASLKNRPDTYNLDKCYISKVGDYDFLLLPEGEYLISGNLEKLAGLDKESIENQMLVLDGGLYREELKLLFDNIVNVKDFHKEVLMSDVMKDLRGL